MVSIGVNEDETMSILSSSTDHIIDISPILYFTSFKLIVENLDKTKRVVFTWWLDHIAYQPAYEYYEQHNLFI
jgi:hypothetical protein